MKTNSPIPMNTIANELVKLVKDSFHYLQSIVDNESSRLHIPILGNSYRISEQELRFAFLEQFLKSDCFKDYLYSAEMPTEYLYRFSEQRRRISPICVTTSKSSKNTGRKANIDLCILDENKKRVAIIEFKANNPGCFEHEKDLIKLKSEPGENLVRLFVEIYTSADKKTLENMRVDKMKKYITDIDEGKIIFLGYSLGLKGLESQPDNRGIITWNNIKSEFVINELSLED